MVNFCSHSVSELGLWSKTAWSQSPSLVALGTGLWPNLCGHQAPIYNLREESCCGFTWGLCCPTLPPWGFPSYTTQDHRAAAGGGLCPKPTGCCPTDMSIPCWLTKHSSTAPCQLQNPEAEGYSRSGGSKACVGVSKHSQSLPAPAAPTGRDRGVLKGKDLA